MKYFLLSTLVLLASPWCNAQECNFKTLAKSLIENDENMYQLSRVFFPPVENSPEFVTVTYTFTESSETQTWYWSTFTSSFIHPPEVMQYMSLLFTKPHNFFSSEVQVSLSAVVSDGTEISVSKCARDPERMQLLTQRLQQYALDQKHPVKLDSSYPAKAFFAYDNAKGSNFENYTIEKASTLDISGLSAVTPFVTIVLSVAIIMLITCLFRKSKQDHWDDKIEKRKAQIWSIAIVSLFITAYNFILSIVSIAKWIKQKNMPLYNSMAPRTQGPVSTLFSVNLISIILWNIFLVWACIRTKVNPTTGEQEGSNCKSCIRDCKAMPWYVVLSFTIFCPIISVMAHSPYIIIGYINDGHHASSIFIYYTAVICIGYAICWVGLHPQGVLQSESKRNNGDQGYSHWVGCATFIVIFVYLAIVVIITTYFVIIPINKSISDTPDRLAGIFESGAFIIVSFVVYRMINFFYKSREKTGLERAIIKHDAKSPKNLSDEAWKNKKGYEKIDELYEVIVKVISDDYSKRGLQLNPESPPGLQ